MSLILLMATDSTGSSNSIVSNTGCSCAKGAVSTISFNLILVHHIHIELVLIMVVEVIDWSIVTGITLPQFSHEVTIEHGLSHLLLMLLVISH